MNASTTISGMQISSLRITISIELHPAVTNLVSVLVQSRGFCPAHYRSKTHAYFYTLCPRKLQFAHPKGAIAREWGFWKILLSPTEATGGGRAGDVLRVLNVRQGMVISLVAATSSTKCVGDIRLKAIFHKKVIGSKCSPLMNKPLMKKLKR